LIQRWLGDITISKLNDQFYTLTARDASRSVNGANVEGSADGSTCTTAASFTAPALRQSFCDRRGVTVISYDSRKPALLKRFQSWLVNRDSRSTGSL